MTELPLSMAVTEDHMRFVADDCRRLIVKYGGTWGFCNAELAVRCKHYRALEKPERFRVQVLLCKEPTLAVRVSGNAGGFRFYTRGLAPPETFSILDWRRAA